MLKVSPMEAYITIHKYDFICINQTYLVSSFAMDVGDLSVNGYSSFCADHPSNLRINGSKKYQTLPIPLNFWYVKPWYGEKKGILLMAIHVSVHVAQDLIILGNTKSICRLTGSTDPYFSKSK